MRVSKLLLFLMGELLFRMQKEMGGFVFLSNLCIVIPHVTLTACTFKAHFHQTLKDVQGALSLCCKSCRLSQPLTRAEQQPIHKHYHYSIAVFKLCPLFVLTTHLTLLM